MTFHIKPNYVFLQENLELFVKFQINVDPEVVLNTQLNSRMD